MKNKVLVYGYYGHDNFGDELFQHTIDLRRNDLFGQHEIVFLRPESMNAGSGQRFLGRLARSGSPFSAVGRAIIALRLASSVQVVCLGGGSLLSDVKGTLRLLWLLRRVLRLRFSAIGVSVGPFTNDAARRRVRNFLTTIDRLVVRDDRSISELRTMGLEKLANYGGDLVALNPLVMDGPSIVARKEVNQLSIGIAPCSAAVGNGFSPSTIATGLETAVIKSGLAMNAIHVSVFALNSNPINGDVAVAQDVAHELAARGFTVTVRVFEASEVLKFAQQIGEADLLWSVRLHAGMVGYLSGVRTVVHSYHDKCLAFAEDVGLKEALLVDQDADVRAQAGAWEAAFSLLKSGGLGVEFTRDRYRDRAERAYASIT